MKTDTIEIVDHGRGPQLSTSRITVQDLLPFYRDGSSNGAIRKWIPALTDDEIAVLKVYIRIHFEEVLESERLIKEYHDKMWAAQPSWTRANDCLRTSAMRRVLEEPSVICVREYCQGVPVLPPIHPNGALPLGKVLGQARTNIARTAWRD